MTSKRTVLGLEVEEAGCGSHGCVKRSSSCYWCVYVESSPSDTRYVGLYRIRVSKRCKSGGRASEF
jgi:hypothetical protein